jgi:hypothetical protein
MIENTETSKNERCATEGQDEGEWSAPVLDEQSACAEICAYVFTE